MYLKNIKNQKEFVTEFVNKLGEQANKINDLDFYPQEFTHFENVEALKDYCTLLLDNNKVDSNDYMAFIFEDFSCFLYSKQLENYIVLTQPWIDFMSGKFEDYKKSLDEHVKSKLGIKVKQKEEDTNPKGKE